MAFSVHPDAEGPDATEMARLIADGEVPPDHFVAEAVERASRSNPALNAIIHERYEQALDLVRTTSLTGPLAGVPFAVKDLGCEQAGEPHHHGARALRDINWTGETDAHLWRRFRDAGLVSLGRTNAPEFGTTITTEPLAYGPTHNPWNLSRTPGGSSGGGAAAVAGGLVPMAHGNDGGGSLRAPAAMCGLVGLKPTRGRVSVGPHAGTSLGGFAVDGVLTRSVRDTALALDIICGPELGDPYSAPDPARPFSEEPGLSPGRLRVGVLKRRMHPEVAEAVSAAAQMMAALGHDIVPDTNPPGWFSPSVIDSTIVIRSIGMAHTIQKWEEELGRTLGEDDIEPQNLYAAELGRSLPGTAFLEATEELHAWTRRAVRWWDDFDVLLGPVVGDRTPELGFLSDPMQGQQRLGDLLGFLDQANVTGQPAVSLPLTADSDAMPIGVQLIAAPYREDLLLRVASKLEVSMS